MKFSLSFDQLEKENSFLKLLSKVLLVLSVMLALLLFNIYAKPPVIVERSSHGLEIVKPTDFMPDLNETKTAVTLMLKARFNTDAVAPEPFLNSRQLVLRENEQRELKSRNMEQSVIVRSVNITRDEATVDIDRIISAGEIRSALKTKIKVSFEEIQPNELNPYGLLLSLADPIEAKPER